MYDTQVVYSVVYKKYFLMDCFVGWCGSHSYWKHRQFGSQYENASTIMCGYLCSSVCCTQLNGIHLECLVIMLLNFCLDEQTILAAGL